MSNEIKETAKEYLKLQLSVIPTGEDKAPTIKWTKYESERMKEEEVEALFSGANVKGLGIICGAISGNLEVIDVDTKYDNTGSLWDELRGLIEDNLPELYKSLVIAGTKNGGYHIYYKCSSIARNLKLSNRLTTEKEKEETYKKEIKKGATELQATARKENDTVRVLIETRGEGGLVVAPPSPGYKYIQGEPSLIPTITPEEREVLISIAKSFNELEEVKPIISTPSSINYSSTENSPFDDYNQRGEILTLLESKGWKILNQRGQRIFLLRPGSTDSKTSGNFHTGLNVLVVFSSSTEFIPGKGYNRAQVFSLLECNGDNKLAYRRLFELGYGKPYKGAELRPTQLSTQQIKVEVVNSVNKESSVISSPGESLKIETIENAIGQDIIINSPGSGAQEEVLRAIEFILKSDNKIYIKEGGKEIRSYTYQLRAILNNYGAIQESSGELTERERDNLLAEVVAISLPLQPLDKDMFLKGFLDLEPVKELGIKEESLIVTIDRLTSTRDKESRDRELKKTLKKASELEAEGKPEEALEFLDNNLKKVKLKDKATEFNKLLLPTSEAQIKEEEASLPDSLNSGISIAGEELLLPGGAISVISAPTNHGKTIFLINTALNVAERYPDKKFIFFTYEERDTAILQYFLNTYINISLNSSDRGNRRVLRHYFKTGSTQFFSSKNLEYFNAKKEEFFKTYIETGRILVKYVDYNSKELDLAIRYLHGKEPNIGGVFIDYFQLLNLPGEIKRAERINSRQEELKEICQTLKRVAVNTGLPLILAAQFNREVTNIMRLHPTHIGEAGDIERIVNTLVGLWNMDKKPVLKGITDAEIDEINRRIFSRKVKGDGANNMYLEILKSRDLPTGSYDFLDFDGNTGKIKNRGEALVDELIKDFK
jgi:replicative DNA helicase